VFAAVVLIGAAVTFVFVWRLELLVSASLDDRHGDWRGVDEAYRRYLTTGATIDSPMTIQWASALIRERRFADAERVLFDGAGGAKDNARFTRNAVLLIAECWYYEGRDREAEGAFRAAAGASDDFLRSYFLGRIAEHRGDFARARALEETALRMQPEFFPALYCSTRLALLAGDDAVAQRRLNDYAARFPVSARNPLFAPLLAAAQRRGPIPPNVEFFIVS
jgi:hypothetical protein